MKALHALSAGLLLALTPGWVMGQGVVPADLEHLLEPKISTRESEKMLVVEAKGDPSVIGGQAFGLLFQLYYSMPAMATGLVQATPRARWPVSLDEPRSEPIGHYALPVPDNVAELPPHEARAGLEASLTTWEYGEVAEILHVGPYDREGTTIQRLMDHIKQRGYVVAGDHEEEYIRGPTMSGPGDPEKYLTIIRYRVQKKSE